jgi:MFS family permease
LRVKRFLKPFRDLGRRVKVAISTLGLSSFCTDMASQYNSLYAFDLGASPSNIGLLTSISSAFSSIIAIPMGWAVEHYSVKKVMLLNLSLFAIHLSIMSLAGNWLMLIPAYIISTRLLRIGPLTDIIFVTAVKPESRGTIISLSRVIRYILGVFAPMLAAFIVTYSGGINAQGIRPIYLIELGIAIFLILLVARYLPPTLGRVDERMKSSSSPSSLIDDYRDSLRGERNLQLWVVLRVIQGFTTNMVTPFIVLWLVESKGATPYIFGVIGATSLIITLLLQIPAGRLADRYGRKKVYLITYSFTILGSILAILAPEPRYLIIAGLIGGYATGTTGKGGIGAVANPLFVTWWWESIQEEKRGRFFGIEGLFGLAGIPASIIGGIFWQQGYELQVLLIPIIVQLTIVYPLLYKVTDIIQSKN